jgi:hypothetical protein
MSYVGFHVINFAVAAFDSSFNYVGGDLISYVIEIVDPCSTATLSFKWNFSEPSLSMSVLGGTDTFTVTDS